MDGGALWAAVHGVTKSWTQLSDFTFTFSCTGEGNGNPLQCFCLENPRDGGAWWAAIYGVTQSRTRLMRLSSNLCSRNLSWGPNIKFRDFYFKCIRKVKYEGVKIGGNKKMKS